MEEVSLGFSQTIQFFSLRSFKAGASSHGTSTSGQMKNWPSHWKRTKITVRLSCKHSCQDVQQRQITIIITSDTNRTGNRSLLTHAPHCHACRPPEPGRRTLFGSLKDGPWWATSAVCLMCQVLLVLHFLLQFQIRETQHVALYRNRLRYTWIYCYVLIYSDVLQYLCWLLTSSCLMTQATTVKVLPKEETQFEAALRKTNPISITKNIREIFHQFFSKTDQENACQSFAVISFKILFHCRSKTCQPTITKALSTEHPWRFTGSGGPGLLISSSAQICKCGVGKCCNGCFHGCFKISQLSDGFHFYLEEPTKSRFHWITPESRDETSTDCLRTVIAYQFHPPFPHGASAPLRHAWHPKFHRTSVPWTCASCLKRQVQLLVGTPALHQPSPIKLHTPHIRLCGEQCLPSHCLGTLIFCKLCSDRYHGITWYHLVSALKSRSPMARETARATGSWHWKAYFGFQQTKEV